MWPSVRLSSSSKFFGRVARARDEKAQQLGAMNAVEDVERQVFNGLDVILAFPTVEVGPKPA
jgi:hypothetical protein